MSEFTGTCAELRDQLPPAHKEIFEWVYNIARDPVISTIVLGFVVAHCCVHWEAKLWDALEIARKALTLRLRQDETVNTHRARHFQLHRELDELSADFLRHNPGHMLSNTSVIELIRWSYRQTIEPQEVPDSR